MPGKATTGPPVKTGPKVQLDFVHESLIQRLAEDFAPAFHENARDFPLSELTQNNVEILVAINECPFGKSIRKKPGLLRKRTGPCENDTPRLFVSRASRGRSGADRLRAVFPRRLIWRRLARVIFAHAVGQRGW